jgi:hypothetical protein
MRRTKMRSWSGVNFAMVANSFQVFGSFQLIASFGFFRG